jgi:hypothetical protein
LTPAATVTGADLQAAIPSGAKDAPAIEVMLRNWRVLRLCEQVAAGRCGALRRRRSGPAKTETVVIPGGLPMIRLPTGTKIWVACGATDMRRSFDSGPLLLQAIGRADQPCRSHHRDDHQLTASMSAPERPSPASPAFSRNCERLREQLTALERWYEILSQALKKFLRGRKLIPPHQLLRPAGGRRQSVNSGF